MTNLVFRIGLILSLVGALPLLIFVVISKWQGDPNPNPVGPGILFMLAFWPGVGLMVVGIVLGIVRWLGR